MSDSIQARANIAAVERETGLGKDTLRVWERRYGFPRPERDENGDRLYPADQIARLRLIKRLMDRGHRPGRLLATDEASLLLLVAERGESAPSDASSNASAAAAATPARAFEDRSGGDSHWVAAIFSCLRQHDVSGLKRSLSQCLARQGLQTFVLDTVPKLNALVGEGWASGQMEVFEEHLYTEQMQIVLRQAIAGLPPGLRRPTVLLTTVPEEQHMLGILMLEALLTLQGIHCVSLGTQTPLSDIAAALEAHRADVVALSFSAAFASRQVLPLLEQLRDSLPLQVGLWVGGGGLDKGFEKRLHKRGESGVQGITVCRSLHEALALAEAASVALS